MSDDETQTAASPTPEQLVEYRQRARRTIAASRRATYEDQLRKGNKPWLEINPNPEPPR